MSDKTSRGPPNSAHTALTGPQERGRARGAGSALGCAVRGAQHCVWGTAIQSQTLLPILTPKLEPFFMKRWLGRSRLGLSWQPSLTSPLTLVNSASARAQGRGSCCLWLSVRKAVFLGLWSSLKVSSKGLSQSNALRIVPPLPR